MKRFRNFILVLLSIISCICFAVGLSACSNGNNTENTQDKDILAIYNMYVAYAEENNTTPLSYSDWLLTIKGEKGDKGEQGIQGVQGEQGIQGEKGEKGDTGEKGEQGPAGINGTNGTNGKDGQDGKSAYEIWLDNGHTGSETDFLNWLKGSDGADGKDGLGIKNVAINDDGDLIITFDNDTTLNAGNVVNPNIKLNDNNKITFNTLEVTENNVYGKVSNETETFSFIKEINLIGNAGYTVYTDLQGTNSIPTKTVPLEIGDNTFYVLETCGNDSNLYTVTIRRKPIYTVTFVTTGENSILNQQVEEDSLITTTPVLERNGYGYTFDYDITTPITNNTTITATETAIFNINRYNYVPIYYIKSLTDYGKTLSVIDIPESIDEIPVKGLESDAFKDCTSLTNITIPDSVTRIGEDAFYNCSSLTSVTIGNSVTSIGGFAFYKCSSLTSITIPNSVTSIGRSAFSGCTSLQYNVYDNAKYLGNETNKYLWLIKANSEDITSCSINENCRDICVGAFEFCGCLTNITIPNSVTYIGSAFNSCYKLTSVYYTGTIDQWVEIEFNGYDSNPLRYAKNLYINNELVTEANITTATKINDYAFYNCSSLTSVTIGNSVTSIGEWALSYLTLLTSITYLGTKEEWNSIEKDIYWRYASTIKTITCTDGIITL